jgi:hypothetical protein
MQFINPSPYGLKARGTIKRSMTVAVDILLCITTVALSYKSAWDLRMFPMDSWWLRYLPVAVFAIPILLTSRPLVLLEMQK